MTGKSSSKELLSWSIFLARRNPVRAIAVASIIIICTYFVHLTLQDLLLSVIAFIVLVLMVIPYYLPVRFILTEEGIIKKMPLSRQFRRWTEFHRYDCDKKSIKLYTMNRVSRLDNYRAFLIIANKNLPQVLEIVRDKIPGKADAQHCE
jgi:hypothetical protein